MPTVADEEMEQKQPSGHRPEGFCCSIMVGHDVCHYCEAAERSARLAVYAECMLTAVPSDRPSDRLSTMVPDDIVSTTHDLATTIAAAHQCCACVASLWTRGSSAIERDNGYRRSCSSPRMAMVLERIVELSHAMMKTKYNGRLWLPAAYFRRS